MKRSALWVSISSIFLAATVLAATPGFVQDFTSGVGGFGGGSAVTRPLSGGVGGASDPYLQVANVAVANLGAFSNDANLIGNLTADGVGGYSFYLQDVGANDDHEIHVGVGTAFSNFWLNTQGFVPPDGAWQQFSVDISDQSQWVQTHGTGTFAEALAASNRLLFRHDLAPFLQTPDSASGEFGLDRIEVLAAPPSVPAASATGRAMLALAVAALAGVLIARRYRTRAA
jgi:hypothetical protein